MKSIADLGDLRGKRVLIRCDLNVPLDGQQITDDGRIRFHCQASTKREAGAKIIVLAHLGRPKGEVNPKYSLAPGGQAPLRAAGQRGEPAGDVVGESARQTVAGLTARWRCWKTSASNPLRNQRTMRNGGVG